MIDKKAAGQPRQSLALRAITGLAAVATLSACGTVGAQQQVARGEIPIVVGPAVRDNRTPMEGVFACFADHIASQQRKPAVIAVGDIKDYTGKYNINEGNAITQGGALMVYSALGKLGGSVAIAERFDPTVAERELAYTDRRQLGDGEVHELAGPEGTQRVPWVPYYGGTITKSDYYIIGGITELNYNINSGGFEVGVNQVGAKARTYNQSIGVDLRIVDTKTLMVVKTISLTKQLTGYEVGVNVFRFFDSDLFDINAGAKGQEPLQLGVRTALEEAVVRLVGAVTAVDPLPCMNQRVGQYVSERSAEEIRPAPAPMLPAPEPAPPPMPVPAASAAPAPEAGGAINTAPAGASRPAVETVQVPFDFGSANVTGGTLNALDRAAAMSKVGPVELVIVARDTENYDPGKRDELTDQRLAVIRTALVGRGVNNGAIQITWRPSSSDTSIHRDGPGLQEIAKLRIGG